MRFLVAAVGHRMPPWVSAGFAEYAGRMPREARIELIALKPASRGAPLQRMLDAEGKRILAALPADCIRVALDERVTLLGSMDLARRLERCREAGRDVAFLVGGAD
ncbi:MAG: 23S rRNA (pseudouridine(1915)-N(3))-methyltransferase RlmH, partial [Burkholderiales bacterium]